MRVKCISDKPSWDDCLGPGVELGKIYTAIGTCIGYGRYKWWPFSKCLCYVLAGFPDDACYPVKIFVELPDELENEELELAHEQTQILTNA